MQKRWWFFHATDFQTLLRPCFTVCRIIGMFPYTINASIFEISKPYYSLSTVIVCVYCVFYLLYIQRIINSDVIYLYYITFYLGYVCYFTFNGLVVIVTHVLSNPRMHLLQIISEIYSKLPSKSHQMLSGLIHTKDILVIILTILQMSITFSVRHLEMNWEFIVMLFEIFLDMLLFQMNMLYMNCICVLKASLKKINDDLMHMQTEMINDMEICAPSLFCHIRKNQLYLIEVKTFMKQHLTISNTVQKLNLIFSVPLLTTLILTYNVIVTGFNELIYWQDGLQFHFYNHFYLLILFLYMMKYILHITLIVWACETCKNQIHEIGTSVCNVHSTIRDEHVKSELRLLILIFLSCICLIWDLTLQLQIFSLQVLHHKNIFSVKGVTVDATLLTSIVGTSTMYVFLLVQFMIMTHSCDENSIINTYLGNFNV